MNRLEALKIAKIAYKEMNDVVAKWNRGVINYLPIDFCWDGNVKIGEYHFMEHELVDYLDDR